MFGLGQHPVVPVVDGIVVPSYVFVSIPTFDAARQSESCLGLTIDQRLDVSVCLAQERPVVSIVDVDYAFHVGSSLVSQRASLRLHIPERVCNFWWVTDGEAASLLGAKISPGLALPNSWPQHASAASPPRQQSGNFRDP